MNLEDYRTLFTMVGLVLMLVAATPILGMIIPFSGGSEHFSELWVLGSSHMAEGYPFNVTMGEGEQIFVGVGNHMKVSAYYAIYVKLRNQTQAAPNLTTSTPSPTAPLYEFRTVIADGGTWEVPVTFSLLEISRSEDFLFVKEISINGMVFKVDYSSRWDSENQVFLYQLFFELWIYDIASQSFQYHNRFVGIWLNATAS